MNINVQLFPPLRDFSGVSNVALTLPEGATVEDVFELLGAQFPSIVPFLRNTPQVVINDEMAYHLHMLHDGDEVELRVPMFGG